jgi:hypothetical protein
MRPRVLKVQRLWIRNLEDQMIWISEDKKLEPKTEWVALIGREEKSHKDRVNLFSKIFEDSIFSRHQVFLQKQNVTFKKGGKCFGNNFCGDLVRR